MSGGKKALTIELDADLLKWLQQYAKQQERDVERQVAYFIKQARRGRLLTDGPPIAEQTTD